MNMKQVLATTGLLCGVLSTATALAVDGPALYKDNCAKCHGDAGKANNWRGYLVFAQDFTKASFQTVRSDSDILEAINRGPRIMPAFEKTLTLAERQALVQVVRGFAKNK